MPKPIFYQNIEIIAGGVTEAILATSPVEKIKLFTNGAVVLVGNVSITDDGSWLEGQEIEILYNGSTTLGAFNITVFGYTLTQAQATAGNLLIKSYCIGGAFVTTATAGAGTAQIGTADLANLAATTAKIDNLAVTTGKIAANAVDTGQLAAGAVTNVEVDAAAAIVYSKLNLTGAILNADLAGSIAVAKLEAMANGEVITGNAGTPVIVTMSGDAAIANTGAVTIQANSVTASKAATSLTDFEIDVDVSFETGSVGGNFTTILPCNCTILSITGTVTLLIEATNNGTVTPNINGVPITGGLTTFTAGDALNTDRSATAITANNTGTTGQELNLVTAKVTAGGTARMTVLCRRTN